jgi:hypothetical protein
MFTVYVDYVWLEQALFAHFFMYICGEPARNMQIWFEVISWRGQALPKNARTNSCLLAPWSSAEAIVMAQWGCGGSVG